MQALVLVSPFSSVPASGSCQEKVRKPCIFKGLRTFQNQRSHGLSGPEALAVCRHSNTAVRVKERVKVIVVVRASGSDRRILSLETSQRTKTAPSAGTAVAVTG